MNQLNVSLQHSITTLAAKGWSARKIARELGAHHETVGRYLQPVASESKPAIPPLGSASPSDPNPAIPPTGSEAASVSKPAIVPTGSKAGRTSQCAPLIAQPARAPRAGAGELKLRKPHLHGGRVRGGRRAIGGKERALAGLTVVFVEDGNGLLPGGALGIVDLAQVEDVALHHAAPDAAALDDGPGAMLLAVFFACAALEKHAASVAPSRRLKRGQVATTRHWAK
ncbi:MAG: helix-turn-helix domain-containing protein [Verrucomicrobiota bacterium]